MNIIKKGIVSLMTAAMLLSDSAFAVLAAEPELQAAEAEEYEDEEEIQDAVGDKLGEKVASGRLGSVNGVVYASVYVNGKVCTLVIGDEGSEGTEAHEQVSSVFPKYYNKITDIMVLGGIESISGFKNMTSLKNISLHSDVRKIGGFNGCTALTEVKIPAQVRVIAEEAFSGCTSLTSIICEGSEEVSWYEGAFEKCTALTEVTVPANARFVKSENSKHNGCFSGCTNLKKVSFANGSKTIGEFLHGQEAVEEVILPDSVTAISDEAFSGCKSLSTLVLPKKVETLGQKIINGTAIKSVTIPASVTEMSGTFQGNSGIEEILFEKGSKALTIGAATFQECTSLRSIVLPARLATVAAPQFVKCTLLETVEFEGGMKKIPAFVLCANGYTDANAKLAVKNIILPDTVTEIGESAFDDCNRIEEIRLPKNIAKIGESAFGSCSSLKTVYSNKAQEKIAIGEGNDYLTKAEWIVEGNGGEDPKPQPVTGDIRLDGETVPSLKEAFKSMKDPEKDYVIELASDVKGEKNLSIPKKAKSVTINGNGYSINITGGKLSSAADLILQDVNLVALNKKDASAKLSVNAKKSLRIEGDVNYAGTSVSVKVKNDLVLNSSMKANNITTGNLILNADGELRAEAGNKITVKTLLTGNGGAIDLAPDFNKAITLGGSAEGKVNFIGGPVADGTQIFTAKAKKLPAAELINVFDVSEITENTVDTHLYYFSGSKVCIFGESISYNGNNYALWKELIAQMDKDKKDGASSFTVDLMGDVNIMGAFKLPKKGYESLTINGNGHTITFTGDIKLTGNTEISMDTTLKKINKKGVRQAGKINDSKGKYSYNGPQITLPEESE